MGGYVIGEAGARGLWFGCLAVGAAVAAGFLALGRLAPDGTRGLTLHGAPE